MATQIHKSTAKKTRRHTSQLVSKHYEKVQAHAANAHGASAKQNPKTTKTETAGLSPQQPKIEKQKDQKVETYDAKINNSPSMGPLTSSPPLQKVETRGFFRRMLDDYAPEIVHEAFEPHVSNPKTIEEESWANQMLHSIKNLPATIKNDAIYAVGAISMVLPVACTTANEVENKKKQASSSEPTPKPNFKPGFDPIKAFHVDYGDLIDYKEILDSAMKVVSNTQPNKPNFFNWPYNKANFKNAEFGIIVMKTSEVPDELKAAVPNDKDGDAFTVGVGSKSEQKIFVILLSDRIFRDKNRKPRSDGFTRATIALGHEVYGNVQTLIEKIDNGSYETVENRRTMEIKAFTASVEFIERMIASPAFAKLGPKMQKDYRDALIRERLGLASWQNGG